MWVRNSWMRPAARYWLTAADRARMRDLLERLGVYYRNSHGALRRRQTPTPQWAWLRKNRGTCDREPADPTADVEVVATGRGDWIGWLELATEVTDEVGTRMTARVITDLDAHIIAIVEAEDRPSLVRLNAEMLGGSYGHVMLVDGNDERGIDVGIMTRPGFEIRSIRSNVDAVDATGVIFSRDCAQYEIVTPTGEVLHVLVNHFKSQSGGGGPNANVKPTRSDTSPTTSSPTGRTSSSWATSTRANRPSTSPPQTWPLC